MTAGRVPDDPDQLLALAEAIAREAAQFVHDARRAGPVRAATKSTVTDMVTDYDQASERLIVSRLRDARPDDAIVGEEGAATPGTSGVEWLIDPIDGTTNYLYGLLGYAVSIGARDGDGGLVGVVAVPTTGEVFTARRGGGARCNNVPIRCSELTDVSTALVATGFSYHRERRIKQAARIAALIGDVRDIRRIGAAAPDLSYVASGRFDAYYEEFLNPWDLAAGEVIAREAGCRIGSLDGGPVTPASTLAAAPAIFDAMVELIARADAVVADAPKSSQVAP
jgi:myo-inositol-1(or 4)-monophosphatase